MNDEITNGLIVLSETDRIFKSGITSEIKDTQGDVLKIDEAEKVVLGIIKRGGTLIDQHSNKPIGKVLNYERSVFKDPKTGKEYPGLNGTFQIFKDYKRDDTVWADIKNGKKTGISIGAENYMTTYDLEENANDLRQVDGFELSVVDSPANPLALISAVNMIAKSDDQGQIDDNKDNFLSKKKSDQDVIVDKKTNNEVKKKMGEENKPEFEDRIKALEENVTSLSDKVTKMAKSEVTEDEKKPEAEEKTKESEEEKPSEESKTDAEDEKKAEGESKEEPEEKSKEEPEEKPAEEADKIKELKKENVDIKKELNDIKKSLEITKANGRPDVEGNKDEKKPDIAMEIIKGTRKVNYQELEEMKRDNSQSEVNKFLGY